MASKAKNALVNTFLELTKSESFDKITVTGLVESCGISRQTFYYHFNDIDEMLKWAFETETEAICSKLSDGKWIDCAKLYVDFFNRYDSLLRCAIGSAELLYLYNLISDSFKTFIETCLDKKNKSNALNKKDFSFITESMALGYAGFVIKEIQKDKSNYEALLTNIAATFRQLTD